MISRKWHTKVLLAALVGLLVAGTGLVLREEFFRPKTITAYFTTTTAIYPGDEVRVAGVKVGTIKAIDPEGTRAKMTLSVDRDVPIPADARAVIVAQNLVAARYVQLAPAYESRGPVMRDGATIPLEHTAVPVEWDQVKAQLMRLATDLGPEGQVSTTAVGRVIDSAADAMRGNGDKLRQTIAQLSGVGRILAEGSGNVVEIIKGLQLFVTALRDSGTQIVQFEDRLATVSSVVDANRSDLDAALKDLSDAVGEVKRFIAGSRDQTAEQIQRLVDVTQNLVDHRMSLENVLHVAPNAFANGYNVYNPDMGDAVGAFAMANFANPVQLICSGIGAVENVTSAETGEVVRAVPRPGTAIVELQLPADPVQRLPRQVSEPRQLVYSDPRLAPGGTGGQPVPPEIPPAVSAYTGLQWRRAGSARLRAAPAVAPWPGAPDHLPAYPSPALYPGAPAVTAHDDSCRTY